MYKPGSSPLSDDSEYFPTTYSRPEYDSQRRQSSEPTLPNNDSRDHSPVSSHGTSRTRVDSLPRSTHSRPASLYSSRTVSSSEDVQPRDARGRSNKRGSGYSETSRHSLLFPQQMVPQPMVPYVWSPIPPMSPMPYYTFNVDNMPLLPPTAPFMMQQHGSGRRSQNSSSSSRKSATPPPASHSVDRLPRPAPSKPKAHQRHSSGEVETSKRLSVPSGLSPLPTSSNFNNRAPHSRPPPFQVPAHTSYGYASLSRQQRRQTAIT